ncbi:MAG: IS21-like element helper ATPase IstB [Anaerolineales bacterium]|jgi:DNA replication protein DnaC
MLRQPLQEKLTRLRLPGFRMGLQEQQENPHYAELPFEERLGLLVDLECTRRDNRSLERRVKAAHFALPASLEDLDLSPARGLERSFILELAQGEWIRHHLNILVLGPTGAGKSYLACALGQAACRQGFSVRYHRTSRLLHEIMLSHADGSFAKMLNVLAKAPLIILDDWLRDPLSAAQARDLLEIVDDRYGQASTLVATQVPKEDWHARFPDPTLADAILDRLVHNAYRLELKGGSMRKKRSPLGSENRLKV